MIKQSKGKALLENAYKLKTPTDNISYYDEFAVVYDHDFARDMGWNYPQAIADLYSEIATDEDLPIADIGCGTGLVAEEMEVPRDVIDGFDISSRMLEIAEDKSLYRRLYQADLTGSVAAVPNDYGAIVSAGTFTHGHLGPDDLENILAMGQPGSLFIVGINKMHFDELDFGGVVEALSTNLSISNAEVRKISMYSKKNHEHGADIALALIFRKSNKL
jgi:predicted TPR repeat methyltransferase